MSLYHMNVLQIFIKQAGCVWVKRMDLLSVGSLFVMEKYYITVPCTLTAGWKENAGQNFDRCHPSALFSFEGKMLLKDYNLLLRNSSLFLMFVNYSFVKLPRGFYGMLDLGREGC